MKKIILYIATSIDHRIAEPDGSIDWLNEFPISEEMREARKDFLSSIDTILMGGNAWRELSNMDALGTYNNEMIYVVSHHDWGEKENLKFITDNVIETIKDLRNESGRNIWLFAGGELLSKLLNAGLVDEMHIFYIPIMLGQGTPLFPDHTKLSKWILKQSIVYDPDVIMVKYIIN